MALRYAEQGRLTGRDFNELMERQFSFYRTTKRATMAALASTEFEPAQLEAANRDRAYTRKIIRRYAEEIGLENKRRAPDRYGKTEMSPTTSMVIDSLLLGDTVRASAAIRTHLNRLETRDEIDRSMLAIRSAIRSAQPTRVSVSPSQRERADFLAWAEGRISARSYQRILELDDRYTAAARELGLMSRPDPRLIAQQRRAQALGSRTVENVDAYLRRNRIRLQ